MLTDPPLDSAMLAAGGARLHAGAGTCTAGSLAGAETEAIGSELLRRPRGREAQARQSADVCLSIPLFRAHNSKYCKKSTKYRKKTKHNGKTLSETHEGPRTNR